MADDHLGGIVPGDIDNPAAQAAAVTMTFIAGEIDRFVDAGHYGDMYMYMTILRYQIDFEHDGMTATLRAVD